MTQRYRNFVVEIAEGKREIILGQLKPGNWSEVNGGPMFGTYFSGILNSHEIFVVVRQNQLNHIVLFWDIGFKVLNFSTFFRHL